jgi:DNA repair exonuclease SbcCD ATPase subunit
MKVCAWLLSALFILGGVRPACAQEQPSLAEVARREAQRRRALPASGKVYTNADVQKAGPASVTTAARPPEKTAEPAAEGAMPGAAVPAPPPVDPAQEEARWRQRITDAREQLSRSKLFAEALQSRINALTTDFVNRSDPYQREQIGRQREEALAELDRVNRDIATQTQAVADIEEEARQKGVSPGWLR